MPLSLTLNTFKYYWYPINLILNIVVSHLVVVVYIYMYIYIYIYIYIYERETSVCMCYTITVKQKTQRLTNFRILLILSHVCFH